MRKFLGVAVVGLMALGASQAKASPYGTAGCGLGSIVFGDDQGIVQIFAATTNGTFATQTFGITSGTSNCIDTGHSASVDQEAFVKMNYASLARDAAAGKGEYLSAFATLLGCEAPAHAELFSVAHANQSSIFTDDAQPTAVLESMKAAAKQDETLRNSCNRL
jgi:hypothetical protein